MDAESHPSSSSTKDPNSAGCLAANTSMTITCSCYRWHCIDMEYQGRNQMNARLQQHWSLRQSVPSMPEFETTRHRCQLGSTTVVQLRLGLGCLRADNAFSASSALRCKIFSRRMAVSHVIQLPRTKPHGLERPRSGQANLSLRFHRSPKLTLGALSPLLSTHALPAILLTEVYSTGH